MNFYKLLFLLILTIVGLNTAYAGGTLKTVSAEKIIAQLNAGEPINYENVYVYGNFDLKMLTRRINDSVYPESNRTVRVFSARVAQPVSFKNVTFGGTVDFFTKERLKSENREYRTVFESAVKFENCKFRRSADFELTNFESDVSFANSTFDARPSFVRIGLTKTPDFTATIFKRGSLFRNFQNDPAQNLTAVNLETFYRNYLKSGE